MFCPFEFVSSVASDMTANGLWLVLLSTLFKQHVKALAAYWRKLRRYSMTWFVGWACVAMGLPTIAYECYMPPGDPNTMGLLVTAALWCGLVALGVYGYRRRWLHVAMRHAHRNRWRPWWMYTYVRPVVQRAMAKLP